MNSDTHYVDLHVHSNYSDGALSPTELFEMAVRMGLQAIAIADHDTVAGIPDGMQAARSSGIALFPAVELSVQFREWQDVHLLGYGLDYRDRIFLDKLNDFRVRRERRNCEILEQVNQLLVNENRSAISLNEVLGYARDVIGRPHIARALLERGYVTSVEDAFRRYLIPCNVPKLYWPIDEAISEIRRIGGVAVLAHPTSVSSDRQELRRIILELHDLGLGGVEVYNNLAQSDEMEFLRRLAVECGLMISGGSDFHGIEEGLEMGKGRGGIRFSSTLLAPLIDWLSDRRN